MTVLIFTVAAPLMSWGDYGRLNVRNTRKEPTKSGIIGLIANALGMGRTDSLDRFETMRIGVRVDQEGQWNTDFQTCDAGSKNYTMHKDYIADAKFTIGIEDTDENLREYCKALAYPQRPLYFGRRAFAPSEPLRPHIVESSLEDELLAGEGRVVVEPKDDDGQAEVVFDSPTSFAPKSRGWAPRLQKTIRAASPRKFGDRGTGTGLSNETSGLLEPVDFYPPVVAGDKQ